MTRVVVMVMAVVEVNGKQSVQCTIGLEGDKDGVPSFIYLGSLNCDFKQFGLVNSYIKKIPAIFVDYRSKKWDDYIANILKELMS